MKLASVLLPFVLASTVTATPLPKRTSTCLTDAKANYFVQGFKSILTNPDREAANATAQVLVATGYVETSDSINSLAGYPVRIFIHLSIPRSVSNRSNYSSADPRLLAKKDLLTASRTHQPSAK